MMLEVRRQDPLPLTRCGRFSTPVIVRAALGLSVFLMLLTSRAEPIQAACIPDEASVESGQTVICTDPNAVGYTVPTNIDDVTVEISEGASFELLGDGISINDRGGIVNAGTISVGAGGSTGLIAGNGLDGENPITIQNAATGSISVLSAGAYGIRAGNFAEIELVEGSTLTLGEDAAGSVGLLTGSDGQVDHYGDATVEGIGGTAFALGAGSNFGQLDEPQGRTPGTITLSAESSVGISGSERNQILSWGNLESTANQTTGILLTNPSNTPETGGAASNRDVMNFSGSGSRGVVSGSYSISGNSSTGSLSFTGPDSTAVESGNIGITRNQGSIVMDGDRSTALKTGNGESLDTGGVSSVENTEDALIELSGEDSVGIEVGRYGFVENLGEVSVSGSGSTAIRSGAESYILNLGTIQVSGSDSIGVHTDGLEQPEPTPGADFPVFANADGARLTSEDPDAGPLLKLEKLEDDSRRNRVVNVGTSSDGLDTPSLISAYVNPIDPTLNPGVAIQGSEGADRIINGADIQGLVLLGGGADIYESFITGRITDLGSGTLDGGAGTDTLDLTVHPDRPSTETGFFDLGLVQNFEEIRVSGGRWKLSRTASANTNLVVASGGTLRIETPLSIPGDYSHEAPTEPSDPLARVEVVLTLESEGQGEGLLQVEGKANLSNGELEIEVLRDLTSGDFPSGDFLLVESGGVLSGEFDSVSEPLGTLTYTEHKLTLELVAMNANQKATSNYIESLPTTGLNPQLESFLDTIKDLNYSEYLNALDQLMPEAYDAQADATLELANQYTDLLLSRPNYCVVKPDEASVHPTTQLACQKRAFEPWMNLYGQRHKRTGTDGHISYHDEGGGLVVGFDHRVNHQLLLTASAGVGYDIIHVDNVGRGRLGTVDIGFAASWDDGPLRLQGAATYGYGWNQRYREVDIADFSSRARSEYGMNRVGLRARAEYGFRLGHLQIAPLVSLDYTALIRPSITETEGGAANLYIDGTTNNITTVRVGLDLGSALHKRGYWTELLENADGVWRPQLTVAWRQVVTGAHRDITSRLLGAPGNTFTIEADAADRGFEVGAGLDWSPAPINRFTFGVHYDAFVWKDVLNQTIMGQVRFSF